MSDDDYNKGKTDGALAMAGLGAAFVFGPYLLAPLVCAAVPIAVVAYGAKAIRTGLRKQEEGEYAVVVIESATGAEVSRANYGSHVEAEVIRRRTSSNLDLTKFSVRTIAQPAP